MTQAQALKIISKALTPTFARLAFGANLYEAGDRHSPFAVRAHTERQKIRKALEVLTGPKQLEMFIRGNEKGG